MSMWKNYANFSARTNRRGYWMAFLVDMVVTTVLAWIFEKGNGFMIPSLYTLATIVPMFALNVRRLRDGGKRWTYLFISLIPIVGGILMLIQLCKGSIPEDGIPTV